MRIGIVSETFLPKWDGIANTLCRLLEHLQAEGHEVLMMAPEGAPTEYAGAKILGQPRFSCPFYKPLKLAMPRAGMGAELMAWAPDVVHMVNPALMCMTVLKQTRSFNVPVLMSYHTDIPGYLEKYGVGIFTEPIWAFFRWLHNEADLNVCPSETCRQELVGRGFERMEIWGRGVDTGLFQPGRRTVAMRERLSGGHPDAPLLIYAGRLAVEKRVDVLRPVLDRFPDARLAILGDGPERENLEEMFAGTNTVFTGFLRGEELAAAYAAGDVFTFPGEHETFGNVVLEAQASGLPVLAARAGGPIDHVFDGRNGYLFAPGESNDLIRLLEPVLADDEWRAQLRQGALDYAASQTWPMIMDTLVDKYEMLAAGRAARILQAG